ncbi:MAG TPA: hypothetical protein VJU34_01310 [Phenylobacterium sp.]|nr:hypothetical protein [Phenylobacterium sp.]
MSSIVPSLALALAMQPLASASPRPTFQKPSLLKAESSAAAGPAMSTIATTSEIIQRKPITLSARDRAPKLEHNPECSVTQRSRQA